MSKRLVIDQKLCDKVYMMKQRRMERKEIAEILGIGYSTVTRIEDACYDADEYKRRNDARKVNQGAFNNCKPPEWLEEPEEQVPGQMEMEMYPKNPDDMFDENVKKVLEAMQKNSKDFSAGMIEITKMRDQLKLERAEAQKARNEVYNLLNIIKGATEEIMERIG